MTKAFWVFLVTINTAIAQEFTRAELSTELANPWEITYGPDNFLWISEAGGKVSRVHPESGEKTVVYTAPDYFGGSTLEQSQLCFNPVIGAGTLGLTLHPDFSITDSAFIYFVYSYNSGTSTSPATKFKIKRLKWDASSETVSGADDLVTAIPTGYDHLGGRLLAVKRNGIAYLYLTIGDHGISEDSQPTCYNPPSTNPNFLAQDPNTYNGKIHRFLMDGTIPTDNPIPGNSFYTRGHRNPQGLLYNSNLDRLYGVEHGDRTDDEINILHPGMNYGWKNVRGYHQDNNYPGESTFITSYVSNPLIANDSLVQPFYSFCATQPTGSVNYLDWCTVAPSDGIYYASSGIPEWTNSLLVTTLKNGSSTDMQVVRFKLLQNGDLASSTSSSPNPSYFFAEDQLLNGRLRDIAVSPDGQTIYLINNGGTNADKITVYKYIEQIDANEAFFLIYPNPSTDQLTVEFAENADPKELSVYDAQGKITYSSTSNFSSIELRALSSGLYFIQAKTSNETIIQKFIKQ
jgi:glucose/arabinose dehydrogenase